MSRCTFTNLPPKPYLAASSCRRNPRGAWGHRRGCKRKFECEDSACRMAFSRTRSPGAEGVRGLRVRDPDRNRACGKSYQELLGGESMDLEWHDNRPCDRFDPKYWRMALTILCAFMGLGGILLYFIFSVRRDRAMALPIATLSAAGLTAAVILIVLSVERRFAAEIAFDGTGMRWRSRAGRSYSSPYSRVLGIFESRWKGDWSSLTRCERYYVDLSTRVPTLRLPLPLTPQNRNRLEEKLARTSTQHAG